MEKVILVGKLNKAELKAAKTGTQYYNLSIAKQVTKKDGTTTYITRYVNVFGDFLMQKMTTIAQGSTVLVEGSISESAYLNKENKPVASVSIIASNIESLDGTIQPVAQPMVQQPMMQQPMVQQPQMLQQPMVAQPQMVQQPQQPTLQQTFQTNPYQNNNHNF